MSCSVLKKTNTSQKSTNVALQKTPVVTKAKVLADSIRVPAYSLPEFKTDPHARETQGNQILGVVRTMLQDKSGNLWFGGQDGLGYYDGTSLAYFQIKDAFGIGITVKAIVEDKMNNIWIGHTAGITKYDGMYFTSFSEKDGLICNDVWSMAIDSTGTVWVGTLKGVNRFDGEIFTVFDIPEAEPDPTRGITSSKIVHCIMKDSKGKMWFGTNGGVYIYSQKLLSNISEKNGLCNNAVNDIMEDNSGNMWFATTHNGLCCYDGESFITLEDENVVANKEILAVLQDKTGDIWLAVKGYGVYRYDGISFTNFHTDQGLFSHATFHIYEDQEEQIWMVGFKGAFRYNGNSIVNITRNGPWMK